MVGGSVGPLEFILFVEKEAARMGWSKIISPLHSAIKKNEITQKAPHLYEIVPDKDHLLTETANARTL
jgi:hypothetical protein